LLIRAVESDKAAVLDDDISQWFLLGAKRRRGGRFIQNQDRRIPTISLFGIQALCPVEEYTLQTHEIDRALAELYWY